jgi:hypothetical protein
MCVCVKLIISSLFNIFHYQPKSFLKLDVLN